MTFGFNIFKFLQLYLFNYLFIIKNDAFDDFHSEIVERRPGDVAWLWCSPDKAKIELGWTAKYNITDMCRDMWKFQSMNPTGYVTPQTGSETRSPDVSLSEVDSEVEEEEKSDSGLSSDGSDFEERIRSSQSDQIETGSQSVKKGFLHFLKHTNIPGPTHSGTRDL